LSDWLLPGVAPAKRSAAHAVSLPIAIICAFAATGTLATNIVLALATTLALMLAALSSGRRSPASR